MQDNLQDPQQALNEEVEETTEEASPATETETPETQEEEVTPEAPEADEASTDAEEPQEATEETPKESRAQKRIRSLVSEKKRLEEQVAGQGQPQPQAPAQPQGQMSQVQAQQLLGQVNQYANQTGQLPSEISQQEYQNLVALANGQQTAQKDIATATLEAEVANLNRQVQVSARVQKVSSDVRDAIDTYEFLNPKAEGYDQKFDDYVSESLEDQLKENPNLNVGNAIKRMVGVYERARQQGGEKVSATLAKQAAGAAVAAGSPTKRGQKPDSEKSLTELEAELGTTGR